MNKNDLRLFFASFLLTLMTAGWVALFFLVDSTSSQYETTSPLPVLALSQVSDLEWRAGLLGQEYTLSLEPFNRFEAGRKSYACLATPQPVRLLEQAYSLGYYGWKKIYNQYKENEFQQNTRTQPAG